MARPAARNLGFLVSRRAAADLALRDRPPVRPTATIQTREKSVKKRQAVPDRARGPRRADLHNPRARTTCSRSPERAPKRIRAISPFGTARDRGCDLARDANVVSLTGSRCRSSQKRPALARPVPDASTRPPRPPRRRRSLRDASSHSREATSSRTPPRASSPDPRVPRPSTLGYSTTRDAPPLGRVPPRSAREPYRSTRPSSRRSTAESSPRRRVVTENHPPGSCRGRCIARRTTRASAAAAAAAATSIDARPTPPTRAVSSIHILRRFISSTVPSRRFARLCPTGRVVSRRRARWTTERRGGTARDFASPRKRGAPRPDAREFDARARR